MIAHWPLEGNPNDEAFGNYNGTEIGGVSYGSGILGDSYDNTSGSGTGIQLMEHADARKFDNVFSWSLWFKSTTTSDASNNRIISRDCSEYMCLTIDQSQSGGQNLRYGGNPQVNEWHHWAYVHESDTSYRTYLDGQQVGSGNEKKGGTARPWVIGGNTEGDGDISGEHFVGKIDDCRFYDHVLSKAEVKELAQGKLLHYKLNSSDVISDSTIGQNTGTNNGATFVEDTAIGSGAYDFQSSDSITTQKGYQVNDHTLSFWIKQESSIDSSYESLIKNGTGNSGSPGGRLPEVFINNSGNGSLHWRWSTDTDANDGLDTPAGTLELNNWVHLVGVKEGSEYRIYKNGSQLDSVGLSSSGAGTDYGDFAIRNESRNSVQYKLDDIRFYARPISESEVQDLYETKARLDEGHRFHGHAVEEGAYESFETGSFSENWNVSTGTISSSRSYWGDYSFGVWGGGSGVEATWEVFPNDERKIKTFEYYWIEDNSQSGHVVALNDSNGNVIQESGTENPQWYLNNGSGGREFISSSGTNYNVWTHFRFEFDWSNGNYDYLLEKQDGSHRETGTQPLESASNGVQYIRFSGGSSLNNYGSANYCRFDGIKVNEEGVREEGFIDSSKFSEVGPAADSLIGWWDFDLENARDKTGNNDGTLNGGISFAKGVSGGKSVSLDGSNDRVNTDLRPDQSGSKSYTFSLWANPSTQTSGRSQAIGTDTGGFDWAILMENNDWYVFTGEASRFFASLQDNTWQHVVTVFDSVNSEVRAYKDGQLERTHPIGFDSNTDDIAIGQRSERNDENFPGKIDDVRVYDRGLTDEEVNVLYEMSKPDAKMKKRPEGFYAPQFSETQL